MDQRITHSLSWTLNSAVAALPRNTDRRGTSKSRVATRLSPNPSPGKIKRPTGTRVARFQVFPIEISLNLSTSEELNTIVLTDGEKGGFFKYFSLEFGIYRRFVMLVIHSTNVIETSIIQFGTVWSSRTLLGFEHEGSKDIYIDDFF